MRLGASTRAFLGTHIDGAWRRRSHGPTACNTAPGPGPGAAASSIFVVGVEFSCWPGPRRMLRHCAIALESSLDGYEVCSYRLTAAPPHAAQLGWCVFLVRPHPAPPLTLPYRLLAPTGISVHTEDVSGKCVASLPACVFDAHTLLFHSMCVCELFEQKK